MSYVVKLGMEQKMTKNKTFKELCQKNRQIHLFVYLIYNLDLSYDLRWVFYYSSTMQIQTSLIFWRIEKKEDNTIYCLPFISFLWNNCFFYSSVHVETTILFFWTSLNSNMSGSLKKLTKPLHLTSYIIPHLIWHPV